MTILVGVLCQDGVVIGADSSATFSAGGQYNTIEQPVEKIDIIDGSIILAGAGEAGLGQRFSHVVAEAYKNGGGKFRMLSPIDMVTQLSNQALHNFHLTATNPPHIPYGALLAFYTNNTFQLCEFQLQNMRPELKTPRLWYCSMGSGQLIVDPFLGLIRKIFWHAGVPTRQDATFAVTWALDHVINCNTGGVNGPMRIAHLCKMDNKPVARLLTDGELAEHHENVFGLEEHIRAYRDKLNGAQIAPAVSSPPKPADANVPQTAAIG